MPCLFGERVCVCTCPRSEEHTSELQSQSNLVCRLLLEKKKHTTNSFVPTDTINDIQAIYLIALLTAIRSVRVSHITSFNFVMDLMTIAILLYISTIRLC